MILGNPITLGGAKTKRRLPDEYQEVEYLESTGNQYIDTGIVMSPGLTIIDTYEALAAGGNSGYGSGGSAATWFWNPNTVIIGDDWSVSARLTFDNNKHTLVMRGSGDITYDGDYVGAGTLTVSAGKTLCLFAYSVGWNESPENYQRIRRYEINFTFGANIRTWIPCYHVSDHKPGYYILETDRFKTNRGTGEFIVGPDV